MRSARVILEDLNSLSGLEPAAAAEIRRMRSMLADALESGDTATTRECMAICSDVIDRVHAIHATSAEYSRLSALYIAATDPDERRTLRAELDIMDGAMRVETRGES